MKGCEVIVDCLYPQMTSTVPTKMSVLSRLLCIFMAPPLLVHQTSGGPRSLHSSKYGPCILHSSESFLPKQTSSYHANLSMTVKWGLWHLGQCSMLKHNQGLCALRTQGVCSPLFRIFTQVFPGVSLCYLEEEINMRFLRYLPCHGPRLDLLVPKLHCSTLVGLFH